MTTGNHESGLPFMVKHPHGDKVVEHLVETEPGPPPVVTVAHYCEPKDCEQLNRLIANNRVLAATVATQALRIAELERENTSLREALRDSAFDVEE